MLTAFRDAVDARRRPALRLGEMGIGNHRTEAAAGRLTAIWTED